MCVRVVDVTNGHWGPSGPPSVVRGCIFMRLDVCVYQIYLRGCVCVVVGLIVCVIISVWECIFPTSQSVGMLLVYILYIY